MLWISSKMTNSSNKFGTLGHFSSGIFYIIIIINLHYFFPGNFHTNIFFVICTGTNTRDSKIYNNVIIRT